MSSLRATGQHHNTSCRFTFNFSIPMTFAQLTLQGSHFSGLTKFPDFSLTGKCLPIFPGFPGFPVRVGTLLLFVRYKTVTDGLIVSLTLTFAFHKFRYRYQIIGNVLEKDCKISSSCYFVSLLSFRL